MTALGSPRAPGEASRDEDGARSVGAEAGSHLVEARTRRALVASALCVLLAGLPAAPARAGAAESSRGADDLVVLLDTTQHWVGTNDVLLTVLDADGTSLAEASTPLEIIFSAPRTPTVGAAPAIERFATYGRRLYRARVPFASTGRWSVEARAWLGGELQRGFGVLDVLPDLGTPPLGSLVPGGDTPTMRDAHSLMHHISSDPEPLTAFYTWSLDDALAQGQPTVFILDSYAYRPNASCGGALGILHEVFIDYPGIAIVHAEPWHMAAGPDGMLTLDPPGGPAVLTDYATAWGISEPPWVFVIDRDGRLHAKFTAIIGSDELRAAMASVSVWRPVA